MLQCLQFKRPFAPLLVGYDVVIQPVVNDTMHEDLSTSPRYQFFDGSDHVFKAMKWQYSPSSMNITLPLRSSSMFSSVIQENVFPHRDVQSLISSDSINGASFLKHDANSSFIKHLTFCRSQVAASCAVVAISRTGCSSCPHCQEPFLRWP